jgi:sigma-B regulation protein RsbU (phosphoserine phosphatase)
MFTALHTRSLNINMGGDSGVPITFPALPLYNADSGEPNHNNIATHVALTGQRAHIPDVYTTDKFDFSATRVFDERNNYRTVSCLALPLKNNEGKVIGVLQIINPQDTRSGQITAFKINDQLAAEALATQAAIAINNHILLIKEQALIKFEIDVQVGRSVQASFLPKSLPSLDGWDIGAQFHPAREVAGDFYDVMDLNRHTLGLVIADVCDKGVPAALYMALTRSLLRALSQGKYALSWAGGLFDDDPSNDQDWEEHGLDLNLAPLKEGLIRTNEYLVEYHSDLTMFATLFFGLLNTQTGALAYVNCGHNPPMIIDKNCNIIEFLKPGAPAIGMLPNMPFKIERTKLNPGDTLMTFTDGVPESRAPGGAFYTDDRLNAYLTAKPIGSIETLLGDLMVELHNHISDAVQFDDITMLAVRREE